VSVTKDVSFDEANRSTIQPAVKSQPAAQHQPKREQQLETLMIRGEAVALSLVSNGEPIV